MRVLGTAGVIHRSEILDLCDNQSDVCAMGSGRGRDPRVNAQLRRLSVYEAYSGSRLRSAWVPTYRQPGDAGTRVGASGRLYGGPVSLTRAPGSRRRGA